MTDDPIERRLAAVERALAEGRGDFAGPGTDDPQTDDDPYTADGQRSDDLRHPDAALADRVEALEADATGLQQRVADLDAAVQALRGYVGSVRHVNRAVERRAEAALAAAERVERAEQAERVERGEASHTEASTPASDAGPD